MELYGNVPSVGNVDDVSLSGNYIFSLCEYVTSKRKWEWESMLYLHIMRTKLTVNLGKIVG